MDAYTVYRYASSGFLALQSIPLMLNPDGIIGDLTPKPSSGKTPTVQSTRLERYFARFAGITSLGLAAATFLLTDTTFGLVPSTRTVTGYEPLKVPALYVSMGYLSAIAGFTGFMGATTGIPTFFFHTVTCGTLTAVGAYCMMNA